MLTLKEARTIALAHLPAAEPGIELVILDAHTIAKPYGWVFFYNSKKFVESGDFLDSTVGNGPMVVLHSGRCWPDASS